VGVRRLGGDHRRVPVPDRGHRLDNGSEFINAHLLASGETEKITFTRSRAGHKNDGCHVQQKNWSVVRQGVGYHRYDTAEELALLNEIYALLRLQTNVFSPQQKLVHKTREGAKVTKRYDIARTPHQRVLTDKRITKKIKTGLGRQYRDLNPAQFRRDILTLGDHLLDLVKAKHRPTRLPTNPQRQRGHPHVRQRHAVGGHLDMRQQAQVNHPTLTDSPAPPGDGCRWLR
jgi:hypothetical protein